jgi:hypothetical protein
MPRTNRARLALDDISKIRAHINETYVGISIDKCGNILYMFCKFVQHANLVNHTQLS